MLSLNGCINIITLLISKFENKDQSKYYDDLTIFQKDVGVNLFTILKTLLMDNM